MPSDDGHADLQIRDEEGRIAAVVTIQPIERPLRDGVPAIVGGRAHEALEREFGDRLVDLSDARPRSL